MRWEQKPIKAVLTNLCKTMPDITKIGLNFFDIEQIPNGDESPHVKISTEANFYNKVVSRIIEIDGLSRLFLS